MSSEPYLVRLAMRLQGGLTDIDNDRKARHRAFVESFQQADGGFRGREGDSDLYYTSFAVRTLSMLGGLSRADVDKISGYLQAHDWRKLSIVDLLSWLSTSMLLQLAGGADPFADADGATPDNWAEEIAARLESVRTSDGGYAKSPEGAAGSTYHTFLVALAYELIGRRVPRPNALVQFLYDRQRDDGGFVEIAPMRRSGTNPTAAAVALLHMFNAFDDELKQDVAEFLREVRSDEGGFQANTRVPFADGLSTFTAILTARDLGLEGAYHPAAINDFLTGWLEFPTGGFRGASWDQQADVEYTFYGLGIQALLRDEAGKLEDGE